GVPVSNNANLQTDQTILNSSPSALPPFSSVAGRGNDLRQIPADNIESIEVIRGIPSARYGDLTSGLIVVNSRIGKSDPQVRTRFNPNLMQAAFTAGMLNSSRDHALNIGLDIFKCPNGCARQAECLQPYPGTIELPKTVGRRRAAGSDHYPFRL
ncbi:MAG: Plug domain-containing protein, partial [Leadbetterella sp.]|nr:Plug domain-containing protein [Leadbetterella sp.]